ncbi:MAG: ATP-binding protein [Alphaproteobacteria bacterium]
MIAPETASGSIAPETAPGSIALESLAVDTSVLGRVVAVSGAQVSGVFRNSGDGGIQIGTLVKMPTPESSVFGMVSGLRITDPALLGDEIEGIVDIELICEAMEAGDGSGEAIFQRGVSIYPTLGADILATTGDELARIYAQPSESNVRVGTLYQDRNLPAYVLTNDLLGKHFSVLGTTGSGKSCSVALILQAILARHPNGRIVLLDPHNEYAHAFEGMAEVIDPGNLHLPYWLLNFEEAASVMVGSDGPERQADVAILRAAILEAKKKYNAAHRDGEHITIDTPVPYRYGDLVKIIDQAMGKLDKPDTSAPYLRLRTRLDGLRSDRRFAFMFSGVTIGDNMADVLGRILRIPVSGRPVSIVDLSGVPSEIVDAVVSVMCRMIFDFALWSARAQAFPVLLVCEEAHRYVSEDKDVGFGPTRRSISRIAKEGRKYGVSLCLVSQRPSELDATILSQCNTLFALRMSNERDHKFVHDAMPEGSLGLLSSLPSLKVQEAVVVGEGVTVPMRMRFDDLDESRRPLSATASFSTAWQEDVAGDDIIAETIERWRKQVR